MVSFRLLFILLTSFFLNASATEKNNYIITFTNKLPLTKGSSSNLINEVNRQHLQFLSEFSQVINSEVKPVFEYKYALNGMALALSQEQFTLLAGRDEININKQKIHYIQTDATSSMVNAGVIWDGSAIAPLPGVKGEGIVVGLLDTGINMTHEAFSATPEDGYDYSANNPNGAGVFLGWCDVSNPNYDVSYACSDKVIGAWDFVDALGNDLGDGPIDNVSHGTRMSSIAAGNYITAPIGGFVYSFGGGVLDAPFLSGIAPHSHIIMYDVCDKDGACPTASIIAGIEQAIIDDVDVINMSLDGGTQPWEPGSLALALLNANNAGIVTATAAGNATSIPFNVVGQVTNTAPWLITVANSYHGRTQSNDVSIIAPLPVPTFLSDMFALISQGVSIVADINSQIIYSKDIDVSNEEACIAFAASSFDSSTALVKSGNCSNEVKLQNVLNAGAIALVVFNAEGDLPLTMEDVVTTTIPSFMIGQNDSQAIINFIGDNISEDTFVEILSQLKYKVVDQLGFVLYPASLRGPHSEFNVTKPDFTAPGTNVFSAIAEVFGATAPQYYTGTGTSQSTAVTSGVLALMKSHRPTWSPSELKSALMLTAQTGIVHLPNRPATDDDHTDSSLVTVDEVGSGMLDVAKAANTGLVMNEVFTNYIAANPQGDNNAKDLNLASLRNNHCLPSCSWTRIMTNKSEMDQTWVVSVQTDIHSQITVNPNSFTLSNNESIELSIMYDWLSASINEHRFGSINLTENLAQSPQLSLSVVVYLEDLIFSHGFE